MQERIPQDLIEEFISAQAVGRKLDGRTIKAYQSDVEHFYRWLGTEPDAEEGGSQTWAVKIGDYLSYLSREKGLRVSTIYRKSRVLGYYLSYLSAQGRMPGLQPPEADRGKPEDAFPANREQGKKRMGKREVDAFFRAIEQEYKELGSDFRRRVCLRDQVMMEILFYHGVEVSELLRMEAADYSGEDGILTVHRKRQGERRIRLFSQSLKGHMEQWLGERVYFVRFGQYRDVMSPSKEGKPLSMKMVIRIFDKYRGLAGIAEEYKPKDLKNSMERYAREMMEESCGKKREEERRPE